MVVDVLAMQITTKLSQDIAERSELIYHFAAAGAKWSARQVEATNDDISSVA